MSNFKISSLNVNGARDVNKRAQVYELMKLKNIDVMFLQETHSTKENEVEWMKEWEGKIVLSHKTALSAGVAVLFSKTCLPISYDIIEVIQGRLIKIIAKFENVTMELINVYAPVKSIERMLFLETLCGSLKQCNMESFLIMGGDFNCTSNDLDRNHIEPHMASKNKLLNIIKTLQLCDVWRNFHCNERQYTWAHVKENSISLARLDLFYCFKYQKQCFKSCYICPVGFSDHSMVVACVFINFVKIKSAYWHFNNALLEDAHFCKCFSFFWLGWKSKKSSFTSIQQWWDIGKVQIQKLCNQYTFNVTRDMAQSIRSLEMDIVELQTLNGATANQNQLRAFKGKKATLADLLGTRSQGALVRSRFQSFSEMDAPSNFFFSLERKNGQRKSIQCLRSEDGKVLTEISDIRKRAVSFYKELYTRSFVDGQLMAEFVADHLPKVNEDSYAKLVSPLKIEEVFIALQSMKNGKAPGLDGLPVEFYKAYWHLLGEDLLAVLSDSLDKGQLPLSCRRAVLTLLPIRKVISKR